MADGAQPADFREAERSMKRDRRRHVVADHSDHLAETPGFALLDQAREEPAPDAAAV
jgi:hypothetical protein